ncbi:MAG TPA: hypothetical protein VND66_02095, partial [Acidobacteriaceae bacterium]|nr:hypothetical protein [Acidobacteriaceae bacterium]
MRTLRSLCVPVLAGAFLAGGLIAPAIAQQNDGTVTPPQDPNSPQWSCPSCQQPNAGQGTVQPQDGDQPYVQGPSDNNGSGAQSQDQGNGQYNGTPPPPPPDNGQQDNGQYDNGQAAPSQQPDVYTGSEDPGRAAVQQVDSAPPPFPVDAYDQPPMPGDGYAWTPGYWGWDDGWDWVPGAWVYPPYVGALWTPGYWGWGGGLYGWYPGYWGLSVGFYGGIFYGCGYWGRGFYGGRWDGGRYYNNRYANNIRNASYHTYNGTRGPGGWNGHQFNSA